MIAEGSCLNASVPVCIRSLSVRRKIQLNRFIGAESSHKLLVDEMHFFVELQLQNVHDNKLITSTQVSIAASTILMV
jgi:hypothetical protein